MIKLDVKDYCQNCPTFDADVVRSDKSYNADAGRFIYVGDTTVRCRHREHCEWLKQELSQNDRKEK